MKTLQILGLDLHPESTSNILEKIKKYISEPNGFFHIVSVNPENLVEARKNEVFKKVVETAQIQIMDGVGIGIAAKILNKPHMERLTGVDLMEKLLLMAHEKCLRVLLIGGSPKVAAELAKCYASRYNQIQIKGVTGIKDIKNPQLEEENEIFSIVADFMPQIIFVSFGSPAQELWIDRNKTKLNEIVCMGVGGAFDFLSGRVARAPKIARQFGVEWLFRLILQPWRFKRQLKLLNFIGLIIEDKLKQTSENVS